MQNGRESFWKICVTEVAIKAFAAFHNAMQLCQQNVLKLNSHFLLRFTQIGLPFIYYYVSPERHRLLLSHYICKVIALQARCGPEGEWSASCPGRTLPPGKTRYPFYRRLGGPQGWSRRAENLVPTGIRSRTVQPVAQSLYQLSYPAHTSSCRKCVRYAPYTRPTQRLSRPPPIHKLGAENHMLQLNI